MLKNIFTLLFTVLFAIACGKKNADKPSGIVPHNTNPTQKTTPTNPVKPAPTQTNILQGKWATDCIAKTDAGSRIRYVIVDKGQMKYEEQSFSDSICTGPGSISAEYSAFIAVGTYSDSVVTHAVDEYDDMGNLIYTWYLRLDGNKFLDISESFLTSRSTSDYGDYYNKIN